MSMPTNAVTASTFRPVSTPVSLTQLIRQHASSIGLLLERLGVARCDVDDARQRVWLTAARCIEQIRAGCEGAFLRSVARREAGHVRRSYRRRAEVMDGELEQLVCTAPLGDELILRRQRLEDAVAVFRDMDESLQLVLWLSEVNEMPTRAIAGLLSIPVGTVKSRLRRARIECSRRAANHSRNAREAWLVIHDACSGHSVVSGSATDHETLGITPDAEKVCNPLVFPE
jgi:RNA polymerase sigma-70 factor, ECF subfamily